MFSWNSILFKDRFKMLRDKGTIQFKQRRRFKKTRNKATVSFAKSKENDTKVILVISHIFIFKKNRLMSLNITANEMGNGLLKFTRGVTPDHWKIHSHVRIYYYYYFSQLEYEPSIIAELGLGDAAIHLYYIFFKTISCVKCGECETWTIGWRVLLCYVELQRLLFLLFNYLINKKYVNPDEEEEEDEGGMGIIIIIKALFGDTIIRVQPLLTHSHLWLLPPSPFLLHTNTTFFVFYFGVLWKIMDFPPVYFEYSFSLFFLIHCFQY